LGAVNCGSELLAPLLHSQIDLSVENRLSKEVKIWFARALQKGAELDAYSETILASRQYSCVHNAQLDKRLLCPAGAGTM
jgi:hypothetical protein